MPYFDYIFVRVHDDSLWDKLVMVIICDIFGIAFLALKVSQIGR